MFRILLAVLLAFGATLSSAMAELAIPREVIEAGLKTADCPVSYDEATRHLDAPHDLGGGQMMQEILCSRSAYQYTGIFFAYEAASPDQARVLVFRFPKIRGYESRHSVASPEYNARTKVLTSFDKGRAAGDCGSAGEWTWNGHDFLLTRYWLKVDCNGKRFNPKTWPKQWLVFPKK